MLFDIKMKMIQCETVALLHLIQYMSHHVTGWITNIVVNTVPV